MNVGGQGIGPPADEVVAYGDPVVALSINKRSFRNRGTEDVFDGNQSKAARQTCPSGLWPAARRKLDQLNRVTAVRQLTIPPGNRLERLRGDRSGQYSIRINSQYRICFTWEEGYADQVEITDYH